MPDNPNEHKSVRAVRYVLRGIVYMTDDAIYFVGAGLVAYGTECYVGSGSGWIAAGAALIGPKILGMLRDALVSIRTSTPPSQRKG